MTDLRAMAAHRLGICIVSFWGAVLVAAAVFSVAISVVAIAAGLSVAASAKTMPTAAVKRMIIEEAYNSAVPPSLALAVARVESNFDVSAESHKGARGVMQIMPATARGEFGVDPHELWDTRLNIQLGIGFLEQLIDRYQGRWDLALSHYNGGTISGAPGALRVKPVTRSYVRSVLRWQRRYAEQARVWNVNNQNSDGWAAARTRVIWHDPEPGVAETIKPVPEKTRVIRHAARKAVEKPEPFPAGFASAPALDDFDGNFHKRLARIRGTLDDFGSRIVWTEG